MLLTGEEMDTIGEVMNMSMGAAATAVSSMLDRQVIITTPHLDQATFDNIDYSELEPAIIVKIRYVEGIDGANAIMLRRRDMQMLLNLLMGNDEEEPDDNFEFDEMSMSAACEVMNQMMGASATALSEILNKPINISTPEALLVDSNESTQAVFADLTGTDVVVSISFCMKIKDVLDTNFSCFLPLSLAREIVVCVESSIGGGEGTQTAPAPAPAPAPAASAQAPIQASPQAAQAVQAPAAAAVQQPVVPQQPSLQPSAPPVSAAAQPAPDAVFAAAQGFQPPAGYNYAPQPPMGYPPLGGGYTPPGYAAAPPAQAAEPVTVRPANFPDFGRAAPAGDPMAGSNMDLLMNVPLEVSIIVGRARRKIREIMDFGQGTVVELDKQAGSPAEVMVNGQLVAYGDVVVIGDNFGVRITEIVGTKGLIDSAVSRS